MTPPTETEGSHAAPVDGVILAAGAARRMGRPKSSLVIDGRTFMERVTYALREGGCRETLVVARPGDGSTTDAATMAGARVVINADENAEQVDSLRLALRNVEDGVQAVVVLPVDHPLVRPATVRALIEAWLTSRHPIVRAVFNGQPGHPTLFARAVFEDLLERDLPNGAESVLEAHAGSVLDVAVDDRGVVADIDTPDDLRRHAGGGGA